jgi:hypothetical protein
MNAGTPNGIAVGVGLAVFLLTIPLLAKASRIEAASVVPLIGIACSPHAYGYEAILALPAFWFIVSRRSASVNVAVFLAYCIAPLYVLARPMHVDVLALPIIGALALWVGARLTLPLRRASRSYAR